MRLRAENRPFAVTSQMSDRNAFATLEAHGTDAEEALDRLAKLVSGFRD